MRVIYMQITLLLPKVGNFKFSLSAPFVRFLEATLNPQWKFWVQYEIIATILI